MNYRNIWDYGAETWLDCCQQCGRVPAEGKPGEADPFDAGLLEVVDEEPEVVNRLAHGLGESSQSVAEVPGTARRVAVSASTMKWQDILQNIVALAEEPGQREDRAIQQVR